MDPYLLKQFDDLIGRIVAAKKLCEEKLYEDCYRELDHHVRSAWYSIQDDINTMKITEIGVHRNEEMTEAERTLLLKLNSTLVQVEKQVIEEAQNHVVECEHRLKSGNDPFIRDYEIEVTVTYYIGEDDPAYCDDRDNIIAQHEFSLKRPADFEILADGYNCNEFPIDVDLQDRDYHCWLFHRLYDHSEPSVSWRDLLRIAWVWVDVTVEYQNSLKIQ